MSSVSPAARRLGVAIGVAALGAFTLVGLPTTTQAAAHANAVPGLGQHIAVPAYIPLTDGVSWNQLSSGSAQLGLVIANVASGPGGAADPGWQTVINATRAGGATVLGYVDTGYFGFAGAQTALGRTDATSWLVQAEQDVNRWYAYYGASMGGIFFDDAENVCGPTATGQQYVTLYRELSDYVHTFHPGSVTVLNPGVAVPECYQDAADVLVTYEGADSGYLSPTGDQVPQQWQLDADPDKFWNLIYDVPQDDIAAVLGQSKQDNAGYVYVTPRTLDSNPWLAAPAADYFSAELAATEVTDHQAPPIPPKPYTTAVSPTEIRLGWTSAGAGHAVGYTIYANGTRIGTADNFTPADTEFDVTGLQPDTQYVFTIRSRDEAGAASVSGPAFTVTTEPSFGAPPSAPRPLRASDLSSASVTLTWSGSMDHDESVAYYDVYENGDRELTVDPGTTAVTVGGLAPGQTYTFQVGARDTTGTLSPRSNLLTVTTQN
ncbi:MAG TPA: spherulation-specific family 4 protein [Pseudonocardiaceae bacterium]|jgi:chitodextrinase|nr:spherulation-specific family 4 protein [Pseudonocardiaceae bacterium]